MNNSIRIAKAYWIWGLFPSNESIFLNKLQSQVQKVLKSPRFAVHITLCGPYLNLDETFIKKLNTLSKNYNPVSIDVNGYDHTIEPYESFYISIKNSEELNKLRMNIIKLKKFNFRRNYSPHISLTYGLHDTKEKEILTSKLPKLQKYLEISSIALVKVDENIKLWNIVKTFDFKN